jgi:hypothetical protein
MTACSINLGRLFGSQIFVRNNRIEGIRAKGSGSGELPPAVGIKFFLPEPIKEWPELSSPVTDVLVLGNVFRNLNQTGDDKEYGVHVVRKGKAAAVFMPEALEDLKDSVINETSQNSFDSSVRAENRFVIEPEPTETDDGTTVS